MLMRGRSGCVGCIGMGSEEIRMRNEAAWP